MEAVNISASLQDYLETILNLSMLEGPVRVTDIANELNIAKASVTNALNLLKKQGYILHEKYGPVEMTEKGRKAGRAVKRRHEVLLEFLEDVLGVNHQAAEEDACLMEHSMSAETLEKLVAFLEARKNG